MIPLIETEDFWSRRKFEDDDDEFRRLLESENYGLEILILEHLM